jgi:DNA-binding winged helix-turn-helix (wHTH) protein
MARSFALLPSLLCHVYSNFWFLSWAYPNYYEQAVDLNCWMLYNQLIGYLQERFKKQRRRLRTRRKRRHFPTAQLYFIQLFGNSTPRLMIIRGRRNCKRMDTIGDWTSDPPSISSVLPHPTPSVLLGPYLWFDPPNRTLWRKRKRTLLTPRETQVLILLLQAPGCYLSSRLLADWLSPPKGKPVFEHSIEQTISGLRHKLGESGKRQRILQSQRSSGYRIFLPKIEITEQAKTLQAKQHRTLSTPKT